MPPPRWRGGGGSAPWTLGSAPLSGAQSNQTPYSAIRLTVGACGESCHDWRRRRRHRGLTRTGAEHGRKYGARGPARGDTSGDMDCSSVWAHPVRTE